MPATAELGKAEIESEELSPGLRMGHRNPVTQAIAAAGVCYQGAESVTCTLIRDGGVPVDFLTARSSDSPYV